MQPRTLKSRGDQERRRFFAGVAVDANCTSVTATLIAASGRGLEARLETATSATVELPAEVQQLASQLRSGGSDSAQDLSLLAAQLAESQAEVLQQLAATEHDVWPRLLLCGVFDPELPAINSASPCYLSLCDAARLSDLSVLNIVDAFPARDVAQDGDACSLDALPLWLLFHHPEQHRLLVLVEERARVLYLPGSRDESAAAEVLSFEIEATVAGLDTLSDRMSAREFGEVLFATTEATDSGGELLNQLRDSGATQLPPIQSLAAASAAVLAMLHIDQIPANLPSLTGAKAPRVLGRLTPGSAQNWNRLLRDLAFAKPLIAPLRSAL